METELVLEGTSLFLGIVTNNWLIMEQSYLCHMVAALRTEKRQTFNLTRHSPII